jgi:general stress protein 26
MTSTYHPKDKEAIDKLKIIVEDIMICLFCTDLKTDDGSTCRPMAALKVCDQGNVWFFSEKNSEKNTAITNDKNVQLFFSQPVKNSYLVLNGEAEIILDKSKIEELWSPPAQVWFKEGKDDANISIIKVNPTSAYNWEIKSNRMVNLFKIATDDKDAN